MNYTDNEREAIKAEVEARYPLSEIPSSGVHRVSIFGHRSGFTAGAEWAFRRDMGSEPQGEPSDAQVEAAAGAWMNFHGRHEHIHVMMRAALRAAGGVAPEGPEWEYGVGWRWDDRLIAFKTDTRADARRIWPEPD